MKRRIVASLAEEPYRLFFPLGIGVGIVGVALWPLWLAGWLEPYPGPAHVRMMTEGFFTAFILGFLGTAGPRMLNVRPIGLLQWSAIVNLWLSAQIASLAGASNLAEAGFAGAILIFLAAIALRCGQRQGLPPPGFVLVLISLAGAVLAALTQMSWIQGLTPALPNLIWISGRNFLNETYILLPILGAAPFFLGRLGRLPPKHLSLEQSLPDRAWRQKACLCLVTGSGILTAMVLKSAGWVHSGAFLQCALTAGFIFTQVPWNYPKPVPTLARIAQISLLCLVVAPMAEAVWPGERLAWRHLLVISGFQWVTVCVATWVVFAHAGHRDQCLRRWPVLRWCALAWAIAVISRMAAEWGPAIRDSHLFYAAFLWIAASLIWLWFLLPRLREEG